MLNPAAGHGRSARFREDVHAAARTAWGEVELALTTNPGHATALAREAVGRVERVIAVGGDGTVHEVANGLLTNGARSLPMLAVVPVGTGNDFAKLTGTAKLAPMAAVAALAAGTVRLFDVGMAWGEYFVNSLGVGLDADVARRVNLYKHWPGAAGYVVAALQAIVHRKPLRLRVDAGGQSWAGPTTVLEIGVGPCAGGLFYLTPDARPDDGLLDVCAIGPFGLGFLLTRAHRVLSGKHVTLKEVRMARANRVRITSEDGPLTAHLDGELRSPGHHVLEASLLPGALPVLVAGQ
ncbi:MAG TPA: diacylglycerol kinase family lipid kinase [Gemmatimonadales bacterium]|nr:diacylglycerol kinase family lipid kinase [Gemmatimonadales bacterium]